MPRSQAINMSELTYVQPLTPSVRVGRPVAGTPIKDSVNRRAYESLYVSNFSEL